ncbi:inorganic phosphate transporter [Simkania negevensis]|uniref:Phosphate transporter n=1 Tax=Simkania negevensis TaxID=83561 RepID=A0ABS3AR32_9BACT|nr:inorganic phosphate transporter [Simkania negevensis]
MGIEFFIVAILLGFYVAWNIGANDVANAMGTSVGSRALTLKQAVFIAAVLEFSGAFFLGSHVSETIETGIINPEIFAAEPRLLAFGMLGSLFAAGVWLQTASYFGWPVSTTHSIVGAVLGFGLAYGGVNAVHWGQLTSIVLSWVVSPLLSGCIAYFVFVWIRNKIYYNSNPIKALKSTVPILVFVVFFVLSLTLLYKGIAHIVAAMPFYYAIAGALLCGLIAAFVSVFFVKRIRDIPRSAAQHRHLSPRVLISFDKALKHLERVKNASTGPLYRRVDTVIGELDSIHGYAKEDLVVSVEAVTRRTVERVFVPLQIISACMMAFAHGANDVANAIGPLAAVIDIAKTNTVVLRSYVPTWILALGGVGIVIGLATWGWRVIETVGRKITELTPTRGFAAEFGAATTILLASRFGLPISTTHSLIGAVLGVGLAKGIGAINLRTLKDIVISWIVTVPIGAILSIIFFYLFRMIF